MAALGSKPEQDMSDLKIAEKVTEDIVSYLMSALDGWPAWDNASHAIRIEVGLDFALQTRARILSLIESSKS